MQLEMTAGSRRRLSMTPLIDIIFLLLLFFMLSSTFSKFGEIELSSASGSGGASQNAPIFIQLRSQEITVNGADVSIDDFATYLETSRDRGASLALVTLDDEVSSQRFVDVYAIARAVEDLDLAVVK